MRGCALIFSLLIANYSNAATNTAASGSWTDVSNAVYNASTSDTVLIPASSNDWSGTLLIDKAITLQGASRETTLITNSSGSVSTPSLKVEPLVDGIIRVSSIGFVGQQAGEGIYVSGDSNYYTFIVDTCRFTECNSRAVRTEGLFSGLIYDNQFYDCKKTVDTYGGDAMEDSWSLPYTLGTTNVVVIEGNHFEYSSGGWLSAAACASHGQGGRSCWRYNTFTNLDVGLDLVPLIDWHGNQAAVTNSTPTDEPPGGDINDIRGTRQSEFYKNIVSSDVGGGSTVVLSDMRGGTLLVWSNNYYGGDVGTTYKMREEDAPYSRNFKTNYPGYDQHRMWLWGNYSKGIEIVTNTVINSQDKNFLQFSTNYFITAPSGDSWGVDPYTPLAYPHPLVATLHVPNPTLVNAVIPTAGDEIQLVLSREVTFGAGGNSGVTVSLSGGAATATYSSGDGTTTLTYSLSRTVYSDETGTVSYTQPGDGIEAVDNNEDVLTFSGANLSNSSTQSTVGGAATVNSVGTGTLTVR